MMMTSYAGLMMTSKRLLAKCANTICDKEKWQSALLILPGQSLSHGKDVLALSASHQQRLQYRPFLHLLLSRHHRFQQPRSLERRRRSTNLPSYIIVEQQLPSHRPTHRRHQRHRYFKRRLLLFFCHHHRRPASGPVHQLLVISWCLRHLGWLPSYAGNAARHSAARAS